MKHPVKCQMSHSFYLSGVGREGGINGVGHIKLKIELFDFALKH